MSCVLGASLSRAWPYWNSDLQKRDIRKGSNLPGGRNQSFQVVEGNSNM